MQVTMKKAIRIHKNYLLTPTKSKINGYLSNQTQKICLLFLELSKKIQPKTKNKGLKIRNGARYANISSI